MFVVPPGGQKALAQRRRLERNAAKILQRSFRLHLRIQWRLAELTRQRTIFLLQYRSAQAIQTMLRGRLGRRVFETERWLKIVKNANRLLIAHALNDYPHRVRVFWYKNEAEEEQLYSDYRMLIVRTGYRPPRMVVEKNIREIGEHEWKHIYVEALVHPVVVYMLPGFHSGHFLVAT